MSWKQRFATANTTHDGHLTLAQAKDGYYAVARHFRQIDTGQKGYVTLADIAAWHKAQREKRREHRDPEGKTAHRHRGAKGGMAAANTAPDAKSAPAVSPGQASVSSPASPTARNGR